MTPYAAMGLALFFVGLYATITRTNLLQIVIGLEVMARGVSLLFILAGSYHGSLALAQSVVITTILIEAVTVAIALSLIVAAYSQHRSLSIDSIRRLKG
ncbi:MAG TPA: NADH-quinone oxidoreductase subunit K [Armatimonadota bacterium]|nr:NADH-quinone oxidoreductase subunit K [Armatimonadota bacterium]